MICSVTFVYYISYNNIKEALVCFCMESFNNNYRGRIHIVEQGDTLYMLARRYDVRLYDIMRMNPYVNVYNLNIGDEISIPVADKITE